ncbi:TadE/TadG family type IV pilus assembly protein [Geomicrobium sp. JCM 19038]|uniref:TadE/TadG family type IV pilus assembly protein n=1 Tax=Geomicrobium sp. JCM 19038 TaxID=1460635 RepID=UPI00045F3B48|nr:TadE/TadG family type IV pilus assembly protein [Geomicrobium sp. JCM 19038]GAK07806.1 hypothetical protein JCM19038_1550 [Geomicrobium sp. JCM 19038]
MANVSITVSPKPKRFWRREEGQSLAEFGLVAPIMLMIAIGVLLLGYFVYSQIIVVSAANQGARAGSAISADLEANPGQMIQVAQSTAESTLSQGLNINQGQVSSVVNGDQFQTTVSYEFRFPVGIPGTNIPTSYLIEHTSSYHIWGRDDE